MVVASCRWITGDNLDAAVRCVISSLTLLAVVVPHVVCILLIKLHTDISKSIREFIHMTLHQQSMIHQVHHYSACGYHTKTVCAL